MCVSEKIITFNVFLMTSILLFYHFYLKFSSEELSLLEVLVNIIYELKNGYYEQ